MFIPPRQASAVGDAFSFLAKDRLTHKEKEQQKPTL
jgi:hypothetical protein